LPTGNILGINRLSDGRHVVLQEEPTEVFKRDARGFDKLVISENEFILIEAEKLSMEDKIMKFKPRGEDNVKRTQDLIAEAISSGVKNFYRPVMDPSFAEDGIAYVVGKKPAVGKSYNWWVDTAKKYDPSRKSRLGTHLEYGAFLGVLLKKLVEEGKSVEWAWNAVCNDSKELGHYWNYENAEHEFEATGSRLICGFYDLANTYKILREDNDIGGFWLAGGWYGGSSYNAALSDLVLFGNKGGNRSRSVGWIVIS
jgi:hypothetical protein